jgi:hypothetical protein
LSAEFDGSIVKSVRAGTLSFGLRSSFCQLTGRDPANYYRAVEFNVFETLERRDCLRAVEAPGNYFLPERTVRIESAQSAAHRAALQLSLAE